MKEDLKERFLPEDEEQNEKHDQRFLTNPERKTRTRNSRQKTRMRPLLKSEKCGQMK